MWVILPVEDIKLRATGMTLPFIFVCFIKIFLLKLEYQSSEMLLLRLLKMESVVRNTLHVYVNLLWVDIQYVTEATRTCIQIECA